MVLSTALRSKTMDVTPYRARGDVLHRVLQYLLRVGVGVSFAAALVGCDLPTSPPRPTLLPTRPMPLATPTPLTDPIPNSDGAMDRANLRGTGVYTGPSPSRPSSVLWKFKVDTKPPKGNISLYGRVGSTPAAVDDAVYIGGEEYLYALAKATGQLIWSFNTPGGVVNSPAVANGIVYFSSGDQNLYAVDARTGVERWHFSIKDSKLPWSAFTNPVVSGGVVYIGSERDSLHALDAATGRELWRTQVIGSIKHTPAVADGLVYVGTNTHPSLDNTFFYAVEASTGRVRWRRPLEEELASSAAVVDGSVYFSAYQALYSLDARTGALRWRFTHPGSVIVTAPAIAYDTAFITLDSNLYAVDTSSGQERWSFRGEGVFLVSPSISGEVVYCPVLGSNGRPGMLYGVAAHTGRELWRFPITGSIDDVAALANGVIYLKGDDGYLYAIR